MKAGDKEIYWHPIGLGADLNSNFQISWIDGCTVAQEQNILHPIEGNNDINCQQLLKDNYYQCESCFLSIFASFPACSRQKERQPARSGLTVIQATMEERAARSTPAVCDTTSGQIKLYVPLFLDA